MPKPTAYEEGRLAGIKDYALNRNAPRYSLDCPLQQFGGFYMRAFVRGYRSGWEYQAANMEAALRPIGVKS